MKTHVSASTIACIALLGIAACSADVLEIESISGGRQGKSSTLGNGAESTTIYLSSGYQRVLLKLNESAGLIAAGGDSQGALPVGAIALANSQGSYIPLEDTANGTVAADLPAGEYWLTTTNDENLHINVYAKALSSSSTYSTTQQGIDVRQQGLFGISWSRWGGKVLKVLKFSPVTIGCGIALERIKKEEHVKCWDPPAWFDLGNYTPVVNCANALFGCKIIGGTGECCQSPGYPAGCGECGY